MMGPPLPDLATADIYGLAEHDEINSWLKALAEIRKLKEV